MAISPRIRLARFEDAALVHAISAEAYIPAYQKVLGVVPKPAVEDYSHRIAQGTVWLAELDEQPTGVLVIELAADHLLIYSIAVVPCSQRRGIGSALLGFAEELAGDMGLSQIRLYTNKRMERNLSFYRRKGFVEIGERPHPDRANEVLVDMTKNLRRGGKVANSATRD